MHTRPNHGHYWNILRSRIKWSPGCLATCVPSERTVCRQPIRAMLTTGATLRWESELILWRHYRKAWEQLIYYTSNRRTKAERCNAKFKKVFRIFLYRRYIHSFTLLNIAFLSAFIKRHILIVISFCKSLIQIWTVNSYFTTNFLL